MSNPFDPSELSLAEQIANVRGALNDALTELATYGKTDTDAERLVNANISRSWKLAQPWYSAAYTAISARAQWRDLLAQQEVEERNALKDARAAMLANCPFRTGDKVSRRDGTVGIVQYAFVQTGNSCRPDRVKVAVDWPAPRRIGGDGRHRSTVLASALTRAK
jgi:hypothetical protein